MRPLDQASHASQARRATRRGYTAIEIMLSIAVLGIGAAGVMTMQSASIQGNADAHMLDVGNSIARGWIERLRRDGMTWTLPDDLTPTPPGNWGTNTYLITQMMSGAAPGTWIYPIPPAAGANNGNADPGYGRAFDILGRDITLTGNAQAGVVFCSNLRGDWLVPNQLLRAEVRVYWLRQLFAAPTSTFCSPTENLTTTGAGGAAQVYHFVYAATAIARNEPQ
jgi:prepilin-type N-terminal cleavage/methylation domain-containing protein